MVLKNQGEQGRPPWWAVITGSVVLAIAAAAGGYLVCRLTWKVNCVSSLQTVEARNNFEIKLQHLDEQNSSLQSKVFEYSKKIVDLERRATNAFAEGERQGCKLKKCPVCPECPACPERPPPRPECSIAFEDGAVTVYQRELGCTAIRNKVQGLYDEKKQLLELSIKFDEVSKCCANAAADGKGKYEKCHQQSVALSMSHMR